MTFRNMFISSSYDNLDNLWYDFILTKFRIVVKNVSQIVQLYRMFSLEVIEVYIVCIFLLGDIGIIILDKFDQGCRQMYIHN